MLNRMVELASKSANGTYTATEREALQAEVDQLLDEIDRISQSANFNGAKLLDGTMGMNTAAFNVLERLAGSQGGKLDVTFLNDFHTVNDIVDPDAPSYTVDFSTWELTSGKVTSLNMHGNSGELQVWNEDESKWETYSYQADNGGLTITGGTTFTVSVKGTDGDAGLEGKAITIKVGSGTGGNVAAALDSDGNLVVTVDKDFATNKGGSNGTYHLKDLMDEIKNAIANAAVGDYTDDADTGTGRTDAADAFLAKWKGVTVDIESDAPAGASSDWADVEFTLTEGKDIIAETKLTGAVDSSWLEVTLQAKEDGSGDALAKGYIKETPASASR